MDITPSDTSSPLADLGPITQVDAGELNVGLVDAGPADGPAALLLHGWPYDIHSYAEVVPILVGAGYRVLVPYLRGYGSTSFRSPRAVRNGQQAAFAVDAIALLDALDIADVVVGGFDWGARTANIIAAEWPERCRGQVSVSGYLIGDPASNSRPLPPAAELSWWYQFYFATERGRKGYDQNREAFARLIWSSASPRWDFDDDTFARTASAFANPDHVDIVIHNYRWRLGLAPGQPEFDALERRLAARPRIATPTVTMEGDANGAPHPDASLYREFFVGPYEHRVVDPGVGHNLPQEAPREFAAAVMDVDRLASRGPTAKAAAHVS